MKLGTLSLAAALMLALFVFAQHRSSETAQAAAAAPARTPQFRNIMDLTASGHGAMQFATKIVAPGRYVRGSWGVDEIPAQRLIGSLVVLDVRAKAASHAAYEVSVDDIAAWEKIHGEIPPDGVVAALTGRTAADHGGKFPAYSAEAVEFLAGGRHVLALGTDAPAVSRNSAQSELLARTGAYELSGVAGLNMAPESGAIVVIAPSRTGGAVEGLARLLALLR